MTILSKAKKNILSLLSNPTVVSVIDQEPIDLFDPDTGEEVFIPFKRMSFINFNNKDYITTLKKRFSELKEEIESNSLTVDINTSAYKNQIYQDFKPLLALYQKIQLNGKDLIWRSDSDIYYIEHADLGKERINPEQIPPDTLEAISQYFAIEEQIIQQTIKYVDSVFPIIKSQRRYGSEYSPNHFEFQSLNHIGSHSEINRKKMEFFKELAENGFIESKDIKKSLNYFHNQGQNTKIKWKSYKQDLYYLIGIMIKKSIIKNPLRKRPYNIANTFYDGLNNKDFQHTDFKGVQKPANTTKLDNLVKMLAPARHS